MAQALIAPPEKDFLQKTLAAELLEGVTASASLNNTTGIQNLPGVFVIDRIDANGTETPSKVEVIKFAGTSGSTVTTLTRGLAGTTDQDHAISAIVEFVPDVVWAQAVYDALTQLVVASTGLLDTTKVADLATAQTLSNKEIVDFTATGEYDNGNSGTSKEIDWSNGDRQVVTLTGNCMFTYANAEAGQTLTLRLVQDADGGNTVTLPTSLWPGGAAGEFSTDGNAIDLMIVYFDGTNYLTQLAGNFS